METYMLQEIKEQPSVLRAVRESVHSFLEKEGREWERFRTLHLVGCGDMDFSARIASWQAGGKKIRVKAHRSMEMRWDAQSLGKTDLVVASSFSGRTPRTMEASMNSRKKGAEVWGITGNPQSDFAHGVDKVVAIQAGPKKELTQHEYAGYHHNVPQTKTFLAALLAEFMILQAAGAMDAAAAQEVETFPEIVEAHLPSMEERIDLFMEQGFREVERVSVLGSGPYRPVAAYGAAKFLEMAVPGRYQCLEENNHLEMFITDRSEFMVFLAPDLPSWSRAQELLAPYGRFHALRLALTPGSAGEAAYVREPHGAHLLALPEGGPITKVLTTILALQLLTCRAGPRLGRDIDQWVGGVRVQLVEEMGQELVRNSRIRDA